MSKRLLMWVGGGGFDPSSLSPVQWLKADTPSFQNSNLTTAATADADPVGGWVAAAGTNATQATAGKRGLLKLNIQNGLPVIRIDGVDDFYSLTGLTHASGARVVFCAFNPGNLSASALKYLFDTATGRLTLAAAADVAGQVGWQTDAGWSKPGTPATANGFQVLTWDLGAGGTAEMLRNGTSLGTASYTLKAIGAGVAIGASSDGAGSFLGCDIGELIIGGAWTTAQRDQTTAYLRARWGV